jgi:broad specificity phosphatase PhoE
VWDTRRHHGRTRPRKPTGGDALSELVWLLRHGATEWSEENLHTGLRDVPLSGEGRDQARRAGELLRGIEVKTVLVSPQSRAKETCLLAGFWDSSQLCDELVEWDYGEFEGLTDDETQARSPGWNLFRDGAPGGESADQVSRRVDRVITIVLDAPGPCLLVSHGKVLRALAARWVGAGVELGSALPFDTAAISLLEREAGLPLLRLWNFQGSLPGVSSEAPSPS